MLLPQWGEASFFPSHPRRECGAFFLRAKQRKGVFEIAHHQWERTNQNGAVPFAVTENGPDGEKPAKSNNGLIIVVIVVVIAAVALGSSKRPRMIRSTLCCVLLLHKERPETCSGGTNRLPFHSSSEPRPAGKPSQQPMSHQQRQRLSPSRR